MCEASFLLLPEHPRERHPVWHPVPVWITSKALETLLMKSYLPLWCSMLIRANRQVEPSLTKDAKCTSCHKASRQIRCLKGRGSFLVSIHNCHQTSGDRQCDQPWIASPAPRPCLHVDMLSLPRTRLSHCEDTLAHTKKVVCCLPIRMYRHRWKSRCRHWSQTGDQ